MPLRLSVVLGKSPFWRVVRCIDDHQPRSDFGRTEGNGSKRRSQSARAIESQKSTKADQKKQTHHAPRLPTPHAPTAQFAATAISLQGLSAPPPRNDPRRPAREKMKRIAPTETPATIPNRREYRAQGMLGNRCRSESGSMVRTASKTVAFGGGVASAGEAEASGCCNELAIPSTVLQCLTIGTAQRWAAR